MREAVAMLLAGRILGITSSVAASGRHPPDTAGLMARLAGAGALASHTTASARNKHRGLIG
jgi:hypothetical protein